MASSISITVGPVTSNDSFPQGDAAVGQVLDLFVGEYPVGVTTNQQKLDYALEQIVQMIKQTARANRKEQLRQEAIQTVESIDLG